MERLPIFLDLRDRTVILIGEGPVAAAKRRLLKRAGARVVAEDQEARIAFIASEQGAEAAVARLRARGVLINVADRPALCDFLMPAIVDRDPVTVAIGTGGTSAGLAAALRQRLEGLLPPNLGQLARALRAARPALTARFPDVDERRRVISALLADGGALDPLNPSVDIDAVIGEAVPSHPFSARLTIRSPDPDELTLRAARLLGLGDRLYHPAEMPAAILDRARADAERIVGPPPALLEPGLSVELVWVPE